MSGLFGFKRATIHPTTGQPIAASQNLAAVVQSATNASAQIQIQAPVEMDNEWLNAQGGDAQKLLFRITIRQNFPRCISLDQVLDLLIEKGADVNAADLNGRTPLQSAVDSGNLEIAQLLIEKGAAINT